MEQKASLPQYSVPASSNLQTANKYQQLLAIIEELGKDIRPSYAQNRVSHDRLKRYIIQVVVNVFVLVCRSHFLTQQARAMIRECSLEATRAQQTQNSNSNEK